MTTNQNKEKDPQIKKIKEEFEKKFLHGLKFHKSLAFDEIALERLMADELWSFFSQSLSDYKKELVEEIDKWTKSWGAIPESNEYAKGWNDCRQELYSGYKRLISELSLLQKDKEAVEHD